ncbi:MAG: hypothetical protein HZA95_03535 [Candidatus Vogelbacteria bacterium]|nr:hypothetical protein [Candidatus Vogelbacteria bacterium]
MFQIQNLKKYLPGILLIAVILFALPENSWAITQYSIKGDVSVEAVPENPIPNSSVKFSVTDGSTEYENSIYQWTLDGKTILKGLGQKSVTFATGRAGKVMQLSLELLTPRGELVQKKFSINPASVSIVWETDSYTPDFYDGKPLPTEGSNVRFIAVPEMYEPNGRKLTPSELYFEWSHEFEKDSAMSGYNKDVYPYEFLNTLREDNFSVRVRNLDGSIVADTATYLEAIDPEMYFYEDSPLRGTIFSRAVSGEYNMGSREITLRAEPYFLPLDNKSRLVNGIFDWEIDGKLATPSSGDRSAITLRQDKAGSGSADLSAKVTTGTVDVSANLTVNFSKGSVRF